MLLWMDCRVKPGIDGVAGILSRSIVLIIEHRRDEAAVFALDQFGPVSTACGLPARARGSGGRPADPYLTAQAESRSRAGWRCRARPVDPDRRNPAVDIDASFFLLRGMMVRIGRCRHDRADHGVERLEQFAPLRAQPRPRAIVEHPVAVALRYPGRIRCMTRSR